MDASMIYITTGPTFVDPSDHIRMMVVDSKGGNHQFTPNVPFRFAGFRGLYFRFLIWGIRSYVKGIK